MDVSGHDFGSEAIDEYDARIESVTLLEGDYLLVPYGVWHCIRASRSRVRLLEIAFGIYDEEFDIDRLIDQYGREDARGIRN